MEVPNPRNIPPMFRWENLRYNLRKNLSADFERQILAAPWGASIIAVEINLLLQGTADKFQQLK